VSCCCRRVIRYIFLAYYFVEKRKAKKDAASTAHPNPVTQKTITKKRNLVHSNFIAVAPPRFSQPTS
jgi:hypothetical protein